MKSWGRPKASSYGTEISWNSSPNWLALTKGDLSLIMLHLGSQPAAGLLSWEFSSQRWFLHLVHYWAQRPHPRLSGCSAKSSKATPRLLVSAILSSTTFSPRFHPQMPTGSVLPNHRANFPLSPSNFATPLRIRAWLHLVSTFKISNIFFSLWHTDLTLANNHFQFYISNRFFLLVH